MKSGLQYSMENPGMANMGETNPPASYARAKKLWLVTLVLRQAAFLVKSKEGHSPCLEASHTQQILRSVPSPLQDLRFNACLNQGQPLP